MKLAWLLVIVMITALLGGCLEPAKPIDFSMYVWPKAPNKTRFRLLKIIHGEDDFKETSTSERLFGATSSFAFIKPHAVAADDAGNLYVSDHYNSAVFILNYEKKLPVDQLFNPKGWSTCNALAVDAVDNLIVAGDHKGLHLFDLQTKKFIRTVVEGKEFLTIAGVAVDPVRKVIYVTDSKKNTLQKFSFKGKLLATLSGPEQGEFRLSAPVGVAVAPDGNVYVVDSFQWRIVVSTPDGALVRAFGEHGTTPGMFARPKYVTITKDGFVLVTDAAFGNFQVFDLNGRIYSFVGTTGSLPGMFATPQGIAIDNNDKVYVADSTNRRVQIFQMYTDRYYAEHPETKDGTLPDPVEPPAKTPEKAAPPAAKPPAQSTPKGEVATPETQEPASPAQPDNPDPWVKPKFDER